MKEKVSHKILNIISKGIFWIVLFTISGLVGYVLCRTVAGGQSETIGDILKNDKIFLFYFALCCVYSIVYIIKCVLYKFTKFENTNKKSILNKFFEISLIPCFMIIGAGLYSSKFRYCNMGVFTVMVVV